MIRLSLSIATSDKVKHALDQFGGYVKQEVLATEIHFDFSSSSTHWDINGEPTAIAMTKVNRIS